MNEYKTFKVGSDVLIDAIDEQNAEYWTSQKELELAKELENEMDTVNE